jgi:hypothetical protein
MLLKAWDMSDGTTVIHMATCKHRKPMKTGKPPLAVELVADGKQDFLSKEAFATDYWAGADSKPKDGNVFDGMDFKPCVDELPEREPKPAKGTKKAAAAKEPRVLGHKAYATKELPRAMRQFSDWIAREYPEMGKITDRDKRLIMIASKAYTFFQKSDMCDPTEKAA